MAPTAPPGGRRALTLARRIAVEALAAYPVESTEVRLLGDAENVTFRVDTGDGERLVLRIHRTTGTPIHPVRTRAEVAAEMAWLAELQGDLGARVPGPVATRDGSLVTAVEIAGLPEPHSCVLLRWVAGRFRDASLTPTAMAAVGRLTAQLHEHATHFAPPSGFQRWEIDDVSPAVSAFVIDTMAEVRGPDAAALVTRALDRVREAQERLEQSPATFGLIHGDLHQENYLFDHGRAGAIDFDDCGFGYYLYDLAVTLSEVGGRAHTSALRDGLLAGYQEVRPLPPGLDEHLPAFLSLRELKLTLWFVEQRDLPGFAGWQAEVDRGLEHLRSLIDGAGPTV